MARSKKEKSIDGPSKSSGKNDISLKEEDNEFVIKHIEDDDDETTQERMLKTIEETARVVHTPPEASEKVKVSFDNFVNLVANHNYEEVIENNKNEDVIVSSNLLADLANAHEQEEERRIPAIFIIGVVLGIVITYILLKF